MRRMWRRPLGWFTKLKEFQRWYQRKQCLPEEARGVWKMKSRIEFSFVYLMIFASALTTDGELRVVVMELWTNRDKTTLFGASCFGSYIYLFPYDNILSFQSPPKVPSLFETLPTVVFSSRAARQTFVSMLTTIWHRTTVTYLLQFQLWFAPRVFVPEANKQYLFGIQSFAEYGRHIAIVKVIASKRCVFNRNQIFLWMPRHIFKRHALEFDFDEFELLFDSNPSR